MEKQPHQEYRDELANELKEIRNNPDSDNSRDEAKDFLEREKNENKELYEESQKLHQEDINRILENKNMEEKLKQVHILQGDIFLERGWLNKAMKAYESSGAEVPKEKIITRCDDLVLEDVKRTTAAYMHHDRVREIIDTYGLVGAKDKLIELGDYLSKKLGGGNNETKKPRENALRAYQKAGATDKIVELGDSVFQNKYNYTDLIIEGFKFYEAAGIEIPDEKLIKYADALVIEQLNIREAVKVYEESGIELTKEKLIEWGDSLSNIVPVWKYGVYGPIIAYQKAGATDKIVEWGDRMLTRTKRLDAPENAVTVYKEAGLGFSLIREKLIAQADVYIEQEKSLETAQRAYKAAGVDIPKEKLIEWGHIFLNKNYLNTSAEVFEKAGVKEKMIEVADVMVKNGQLDEAVKVYEKAKKM